MQEMLNHNSAMASVCKMDKVFPEIILKLLDISNIQPLN
jgi:hypothetical protein